VVLFHSLDPSRPVTQGGRSPSRENEEEISGFLDVKGFNGSGERVGVFEEYHEREPGHPIVAAEVPHTYQTRGVYRTRTHWRMRDFPARWNLRSSRAGKMEDDGIFPIPDLTREEVFPEERQATFYFNGEEMPIQNDAPWAKTLYYQSSYDNATVRSSARKAWQRVEGLDYVMGHLRWTGIDYLGETSYWPSRMANFGVIDICGFPKDHYYLYKSLWTEEPMVHLLPHSSHAAKEAVEIPVVAYTNCGAVELFLNGKSLGKQTYQGQQLVWMVPYEPGTIKAVAWTDGRQVATAEIKTARKPAAVKVIADKSDLGNGVGTVVHLEVNIVDADGTLVPHADNTVVFKIEGPGQLIGVDNGDPLDLSKYVSNERRAFRGKCLGIVRVTGDGGEIKVRVGSAGLEGDAVRLFDTLPPSRLR
jgi:beta-galactosidase